MVACSAVIVAENLTVGADIMQHYYVRTCCMLLRWFGLGICALSNRLVVVCVVCLCMLVINHHACIQ